MSELSADEKRRLLRERRQAKMAQGNASTRLNNILSQGASVNTSVVSVLDAGSQSKTSEQSVSVSSSTALSEAHDDPEVPDISSLLNTSAPESGEVQDIDAMLQKIFASAGGAGRGGPANSEEATANFFSDMMKTLAEDPNGIPGVSENASQLTKMAAYKEYQHKQWKARVLAVRLLVHTINFAFHYFSFPSFTASPYSYRRAMAPTDNLSTFMMFFLASEIAIVSSYFFVLSSSGLLGVSIRNHPVSKLLGMAASVFPQAAAYRPLVDTLLVYWEGASILLGDLMLFVVLFGAASVLK